MTTVRENIDDDILKNYYFPRARTEDRKDLETGLIA
jgi:hypothetical protein